MNIKNSFLFKLLLVCTTVFVCSNLFSQWYAPSDSNSDFTYRVSLRRGNIITIPLNITSLSIKLEGTRTGKFFQSLSVACMKAIDKGTLYRQVIQEHSGRGYDSGTLYMQTGYSEYYLQNILAYIGSTVYFNPHHSSAS